MIKEIILKIEQSMNPFLDNAQMEILDKILAKHLENFTAGMNNDKNNILEDISNEKFLDLFISSKRIEGCSEKSLKLYKGTLKNILVSIQKPVKKITTNDLREYLANYQETRNVSKVTQDNVRRELSAFFSWLEDEDYILKNPVRRIRRIKTGTTVKEVYSDEIIEVIRDN